MNRVPPRLQLPAIVGVSVLVVIFVVGVVVLVGQLGPSASPSAAPSPSPTVSADPSSPEGAVRAFFAAFAAARRTDDASVVAPFVTSTDSSAYRTVDAFLGGQKQAGKASVITANNLSCFGVEVTGQTATVIVTQALGGYDTDVNTGQPRESPTQLPPTQFKVVVKHVDARWLVDEFEALS